MSENSNNSSMAPKDPQDAFLRYLLGHGLIDQVELDECLQAQQTQNDQNDRDAQISISGLLVTRGYLTRKQVDRITSHLEDDKPLRQIPGFQMLEKIGAGAMATVYRAKQISLDRIVAVKIMPKHLSNDKEFVERFYKEGRAAAQLNHNNIVQAIDVGEAAGYHYFVMEYVEGESIHDQMARGQKFDEKDALDIIIQVARALAHAHERGFIHRDVKPKNIMLAADGVVKLADLGLAREVADLRAAASEAGRAYGTPYYIAPEQIRGERDLDARIDIYSLGATAYHMVTGRVPFEGPNPSAIMHKHLKQELVPPDHVNTELSAGTAEVIEMMMAKDRNARYKSAKELLVDLECITKGESPLLARERLNAKLLSGLAAESSISGQRFSVEGPIPTGEAVKAQSHAKPKPKPKPPPDQNPAVAPTTVAPILIWALVISVIVNVLLLILCIMK